MSEGGGDGLGPPYSSTGPGIYQSSQQTATPSSTILDIAADAHHAKTSSSTTTGLPPFSSFSAAELAEGLSSRLGPEGFGTEPFAGRLIDFPAAWGYFDESLTGRLIDRGDGLPMLIPQPQYRPWENKPFDGGLGGNSQDGISKIYDYPPGSPAASKLPSFQSQFNAFSTDQNGETISLTTLTPAPPSPPVVNTSGLPSFHTLSAVTVNPRTYPLVPAPMQAREMPTIQQQFIDERHIHLFQSSPSLNNTQYHHQLGIASSTTHPTASIIQGNFVPQTAIGGSGQQTTLLTVVKTEPLSIVTMAQLHQQQPSSNVIYQNSSNSILEQQQQQQQHQQETINVVKIEDSGVSTVVSRGMHDSRKKERRKPRTIITTSSSLDSSTTGANDVTNMVVESSGQVAAISSTAGASDGYKSSLQQNLGGGNSLSSSTSMMRNEAGDDSGGGCGEKQTKKKRKRCGECIGCQRKDNCGDCAPCRNDKSHQICKMRRCEKLTDKKVRIK